MTLGLVASLLAPAVARPEPSRALANADAAPRPPVRRVEREYGEGPVRLAPGQSGAITFRASRGDRVTLRVRPVGLARSCRGRLVLRDRRGSRARQMESVFRVRADGRAEIRFENRCGRSASLAQLVQVRTLKVRVDGRKVVQVGPSTSRVLNVAWVKVPRTGRVKLVGRDSSGRRVDADQVLEGNRLRWPFRVPSASAEHGQPPRYDFEPVESFRPLRRGQRIGVAFAEGARVEASSALEQTIELDGPPVTLASGQGREHVLSVTVPAGVRTFLDWGTEDSFGWGTAHWLTPDGRQPTGGGVHRLVVASPDDAEFSDLRTIRIRTILRAPDLVVGGPPVRFESADPGQWFRATVPASPPGPVRFEASDATVSGGWGARMYPPCYRDCIGGASLRSGEPVESGWVPYDEPHTVEVRFDKGSSGGVTLRLVR
ncbi:hypothetical protein [Nocardioides solisilvae]|uniref:hypothetical protein n=1 Tax=Nocardioides solisilvae TaxID=1542435 RepID=UPI000D74D7F5|nr:hypothetical protein [Nocardioides solisilvae]